MVAITKDQWGKTVTAFTKFGEAVVTLGTAIGNVVGAFIDFVLTMVQCIGMGTSGAVGYAVGFPRTGPDACPTKTVPPIPCVLTIAISGTVELALNAILGQGAKANAAIGVALNIAFTVGLIAGDGSTGLSVGVGIAAGVACGVNSNNAATGSTDMCMFTLGIGVTASASLLKLGGDPRCPFGPKLFWIFKCSISHGITLKVMCCAINIMTGCQSCGTAGKGSCTPKGMKVSEEVKKVTQKAIATGGAAAIKCTTTPPVRGRAWGGYAARRYRGCLSTTMSGRRCRYNLPYLWGLTLSTPHSLMIP